MKCATLAMLGWLVFSPLSAAQSFLGKFPPRFPFSGLLPDPRADTNDDMIIITSETLDWPVRFFHAGTGAFMSSISQSISSQLTNASGSGRPFAVNPETGDLWVRDGYSTFAVFDKQGNLLSRVTINLGCIGNRNGTQLDGIRDLVFGPGPNPHLYLVGSWVSGSICYLLEVDPSNLQSVTTVNCSNLGAFQPNGLAIGSGPLGTGTYLYVTEGTVPGRINAYDLNLAFHRTVHQFGSQMGRIAVQSSGAILVGITGNSVHLSDAAQVGWLPLAACSQWAALDAVASTPAYPWGYFVYGPVQCTLGPEYFQVFGSSFAYTLNAKAAGMMSAPHCPRIAIWE